MDLQSIAFALFGAVLVIQPSIVAKPIIERRERRLPSYGKAKRRRISKNAERSKLIHPFAGYGFGGCLDAFASCSGCLRFSSAVDG